MHVPTSLHTHAPHARKHTHTQSQIAKLYMHMYGRHKDRHTDTQTRNVWHIARHKGAQTQRRTDAQTRRYIHRHTPMYRQTHILTNVQTCRREDIAHRHTNIEHRLTHIRNSTHSNTQTERRTDTVTHGHTGRKLSRLTVYSDQCVER